MRNILKAAVKATTVAIQRVERTSLASDADDYNYDGNRLSRLQHAYRLDRLQDVVKELEEMRDHVQEVIDFRAARLGLSVRKVAATRLDGTKDGK
jgi:hypothetical protein